jgi:hypothetical protein
MEHGRPVLVREGHDLSRAAQGVGSSVAGRGPDGRPHNVRVERSLGMGLDEKAPRL